MPNLRAALADATARLGQSDTAALDAQLLLAHILGKTRTWLYTWPAHELDTAQTNAFGLMSLIAVGLVMREFTVSMNF